MGMQVRREVLLAAELEAVWDALTKPEALRAWFANDAELIPAPGGTGHFRWGDGSQRDAVVEAVEEQRELVFRWGTSPEDESRVEIALEEVEGGTRVSVTETALGALARLGEWSGALVLLSLLVGTVALV
jgi:uncharacterized protein YndB with AHSA1/START domain